jgi:hypothetical protein
MARYRIHRKKITKAAKVTIVTTGILQMHTPLLEKHRSTGNVNKKVCYCPVLIKIRV